MPTLAQLGQQHELLQQRFAEIVANTSDLDLRMQFVVKPGCGAKPVVRCAGRGGRAVNLF